MQPLLGERAGMQSAGRVHVQGIMWAMRPGGIRGCLWKHLATEDVLGNICRQTRQHQMMVLATSGDGAGGIRRWFWQHLVTDAESAAAAAATRATVKFRW